MSQCRKHNPLGIHGNHLSPVGQYIPFAVYSVVDHGILVFLPLNEHAQFRGFHPAPLFFHKGRHEISDLTAPSLFVHQGNSIGNELFLGVRRKRYVFDTYRSDPDPGRLFHGSGHGRDTVVSDAHEYRQHHNDAKTEFLA